MKTTKNMFTTYYGKRIAELNREELIGCIEDVGKELERYRKEKALMGDDYYKLLVEKKLG